MIILCENCFHDWESYEVFTIVPCGPCVMCGETDNRKNGGSITHAFAIDPRVKPMTGGSMELNEETKFILGRPNFVCGSIAARMRELGHDIPRKSEDEQAYVIHWMLELYEQHGADWRIKVDAHLKGVNQ